jgi:hypothetical protein
LLALTAIARFQFFAVAMWLAFGVSAGEPSFTALKKSGAACFSDQSTFGQCLRPLLAPRIDIRRLEQIPSEVPTVCKAPPPVKGTPAYETHYLNPDQFLKCVLNTPESDLGNGLTFLNGLRDCFVNGDFTAEYGTDVTARGESTICRFVAVNGKFVLYSIESAP